MATLQQIREGLSEAWHDLMDGWQNLYRRAAGAVTRFKPVVKAHAGLSTGATEEIAVRSTGWGILACEVFDDDDRVVVRLEAPGMAKGDFDIQVVDGCLLVRGEKQMTRERSAGGYYISECAYGSFERAIPLPEEVKTDEATASYKRGILRVEMPKSIPRRRRRITLDVD